MTPAFEQLIKQTAKKFADKKAPKNPETQWRKGAEWMYDLLTGGKTVDLLRQQLKADVMNREGTSEVEPWKLSLIDELADMLAEKMAMQAEIREQGRSACGATSWGCRTRSTQTASSRMRSAVWTPRRTA